MTAIYNEIEPYACDWLENLIAAGHIEPGTVDRRSIKEIQPDDVRHARQFHAFAGIGVWSYALRLAGWPTDQPVWTGSCPCQPFSSASRGRAKGAEDPRHLWPTWSRLIRECRPPTVFGEQVTDRSWLDNVAGGFESMGYAFGATVLCASAFGAPRRRRVFFVAYADRQGQCTRPLYAALASLPKATILAPIEWRDLRGMGKNGDRSASRVGRLRAYGNAICPQVAAVFVRSALEAIEDLNP